MSYQLLTFSRQDAFKTCRRKAWWSYEMKIRRTLNAKALRMGLAYHDGLEALATTNSMECACEVVEVDYDGVPDGLDFLEWEYERETIRQLLAGYHWRWGDTLKYLAVEQTFCLPLVNPATGRATPNWMQAGKIDGIVRLEDGRLADKENKLFGEDLGPNADLWKRLRIDHQVSLYRIASRGLGHETETTLYDLTRKPNIKPTQVPNLDLDGLKVVHNVSGIRVVNANGTWRQTASAKEGYVLDSRPMTVAEWGERLNQDIATRPEYYYNRQELPRLECDLEEVREELWDIQRTYREAQLSGRWYRTVNRNTCPYCSYYDLCTSGFDPERDVLPDGFERVSDVHPELS